jgi:hypothetical protein
MPEKAIARYITVENFPRRFPLEPHMEASSGTMLLAAFTAFALRGIASLRHWHLIYRSRPSDGHRRAARREADWYPLKD